MCKKLVVVLMMLSVASFAYAYAPNEVITHADTDDAVVSSFESGMDGWVVNAGSTATLGNSYGATDGFYSLKLNTPDSWWNEATYIDLGAIEGGADAVMGNNTLSIDFSWLGTDNTGVSTSGWNQNPLIRLLVNPDKGWGANWWQSGEQGLDIGTFDYGHVNEDLSTGSWYQGVDGAATLSWNYQDISGGLMDSTSSQYKFILEIVHVTGLPTTALYLDNVKLSGAGYVEYTPEPTTICLLGLGSLALLRRKK